jgi:hypothetical protein
MYLTRRAVKDSLAAMRRLGARGRSWPPTSGIWWTAPDALSFLRRIQPNLLALLGEPVLFAMHPEDVGHFLEREGIAVRELLEAKDLEARYLAATRGAAIRRSTSSPRVGRGAACLLPGEGAGKLRPYTRWCRPSPFLCQPEAMSPELRRVDFPAKDDPLRDDVRVLGALVGDLLREQGGDALFERVETVRVAAIRSRERGARERSSSGASARAPTRLRAMLAGLTAARPRS